MLRDHLGGAMAAEEVEEEWEEWEEAVILGSFGWAIRSH
jgi:hypothetical protein